jgi:alkylation response protein AidB-like acyl-CoA dehydrogenase
MKNTSDGAMDLRFTPAQEEFRAEARHWLAANSPAPGSLPSLDTPHGFEAHRAWEQAMFADRWSVVSWPEEFGGRGVGILEWLIFEEEYWRIQAPVRVSQNGVFLLAPTMFEFGTDAQKARFLPPMASGEEIWCQGWSEPDAGSDLAGIRSRAERSPDDDGWLLTGQKTWASRGAYAEWCFGLFRTDPGAERHRGLTYFLMAMDSTGVTVRPIPQIDGEPGFAEIFFESVFVPDSQVLGGVGQGWSVAMATAGSERGLSLRSPARYTEAASRLVSLYAERLDRDPARAARSADAVAQAWMDAEAYRLSTYWTASRVLAGGTVGPEASANKIHWSETDLAIHRTALGLLGPEAELIGGGGVAGNPWLDGFLFALAGPIYAGTNEIQRNVVAERLLGLPRA